MIYLYFERVLLDNLPILHFCRNTVFFWKPRVSPHDRPVQGRFCLMIFLYFQNNVSAYDLPIFLFARVSILFLLCFFMNMLIQRDHLVFRNWNKENMRNRKERKKTIGSLCWVLTYMLFVCFSSFVSCLSIISLLFLTPSCWLNRTTWLSETQNEERTINEKGSGETKYEGFWKKVFRLFACWVLTYNLFVRVFFIVFFLCFFPLFFFLSPPCYNSKPPPRKKKMFYAFGCLGGGLLEAWAPTWKNVAASAEMYVRRQLGFHLRPAHAWCEEVQTILAKMVLKQKGPKRTKKPLHRTARPIQTKNKIDLNIGTPARRNSPNLVRSRELT